MRFTGATTKYNGEGKPIKGSVQEYKLANPDSLVFDSKAEYNTWIALNIRLSNKEISNLERQVPYTLIEKQYWYNNVKGKQEIVRPLVYIADFVFIEQNKTIVLDCKGWREKLDKNTGKLKWEVYQDDIYKIKKKIFLSKHPELTFRES